MIMKPIASLAGLALAVFLVTGAVPQPAQALTSGQSTALAAADQNGSEALATELAAQALLSPADWRDLLDTAVSLDPDAAALLAATLAAVIPVEATEIALAAGGEGNATVCAAVAGVVPAATAALTAACGPFYVGGVGDTVLLAHQLAARASQLAAVSEPDTRVTIQNDESELKDVDTPSPN